MSNFNKPWKILKWHKLIAVKNLKLATEIAKIKEESEYNVKRFQDENQELKLKE